MSSTLTESIKKTNAYACLECGKCTSVCPVSKYNNQYSPRSLLTKAVRENFDTLYKEYDLWSCLTCKRCDAVCPSNIKYSDLNQIVRTGAKDAGFHGKCSHSGAMEMLQTIMTAPDLNQNRLDWVSEDMEIAEEGDVLYFVGCAPYLEVFFSDLDLTVIEGASSSVKLLNALGVTPVLLPNERCCGHDLLWNGDEDNFKMLAEHNLEAIKKTGAKTLLFSCAECMTAFKDLYPKYGFTVNMKLQHMSQFLAEKIESGDLKLDDPDQSLTYQDPCRLGRHMGIYDEPRKVLQPNGSNNFKEMKQSNKGSLCCGVSAWMNCDTVSKSIQKERLKQAKETEAEVLAVACPKCQIHLVCTMKDQAVKDEYGVKIRDISAITLDRMILET